MGSNIKQLKCLESYFKSKKQNGGDRLSQIGKITAQKAENTPHASRGWPWIEGKGFSLLPSSP